MCDANIYFIIFYLHSATVFFLVISTLSTTQQLLLLVMYNVHPSSCLFLYYHHRRRRRPSPFSSRFHFSYARLPLSKLVLEHEKHSYMRAACFIFSFLVTGNRRNGQPEQGTSHQTTTTICNCFETFAIVPLSSVCHISCLCCFYFLASIRPLTLCCTIISLVTASVSVTVIASFYPYCCALSRRQSILNFHHHPNL